MKNSDGSPREFCKRFALKGHLQKHFMEMASSPQPSPMKNDFKEQLDARGYNNRIRGVETTIAQIQLDENDTNDLVCNACLNANLHVMKSDGNPQCLDCERRS